MEDDKENAAIYPFRFFWFICWYWMTPLRKFLNGIIQYQHMNQKTEMGILRCFLCHPPLSILQKSGIVSTKSIPLKQISATRKKQFKPNMGHLCNQDINVAHTDDEVANQLWGRLLCKIKIETNLWIFQKYFIYVISIIVFFLANNNKWKRNPPKILV